MILDYNVQINSMTVSRLVDHLHRHVYLPEVHRVPVIFWQITRNTTWVRDTFLRLNSPLDQMTRGKAFLRMNVVLGYGLLGVKCIGIRRTICSLLSSCSSYQFFFLPCLMCSLKRNRVLQLYKYLGQWLICENLGI